MTNSDTSQEARRRWCFEEARVMMQPTQGQVGSLDPDKRVDEAIAAARKIEAYLTENVTTRAVGFTRHEEQGA